MNPVHQQTSAYGLTWSLTTMSGMNGDEPTLKLIYQVEAFEELYVGDRLWVHDDINQRVPDPFGVYRFVMNGALRLVFAQSPTPPDVLPRIVFKPLFSRIRAGGVRRCEVPIKLPVVEYSALARNVAADAIEETVSKVYLVLSYRLRSSMEKDPVTPAGESPEEAGYIVHDAQTILSEFDVDSLSVKRRTGKIARFLLPGET